MRKSTLIAAAVVSTLLLPAALVAGAHQAAKTTAAAGHSFFEHIHQELGLTPDQVHQIHGVLATHKAELSDELTRLESSHAALAASVHAPTFDENAVRTAARAVGQAVEDLAVTHARLMVEMRGILTPEQQQKAHGLMAHLHDHIHGVLAHVRAFLNSDAMGS
jgi:Spy/CpxP family protein refolding chaperone